MIERGPVLCVCGFSGSGKTTLLVSVIPLLVSRRLRVAAVKHDAHGFTIDRAGKDSDRFFRAGATVALGGPHEQVVRRHHAGLRPLGEIIADLLLDHDLVLVEGHKDTPLPKVWLTGPDATPPPAGVSNVMAVLPRDEARTGAMIALLDRWLPAAHRSVPLAGGLVPGPETDPVRAAAVAERLTAFCGHVVALGPGHPPPGIPALADAPGLAGPMAGALSVLRWSPGAACMLVHADAPGADDGAMLARLLAQRRPGTWAVAPALPDPETFPGLAVLEPQALRVLERLAAAGTPLWPGLARHPRTARPVLT